MAPSEHGRADRTLADRVLLRVPPRRPRLPSTRPRMQDIRPPLCVDLDGTLVRTDLLAESALALLRRNPLYLVAFAFWLLRGKAHLKREIARRVTLSVADLPWETRLLDWLRAQPDRRLVLCTASDRSLAEAVAAEVGLFDEVVASDGVRNLAGARKAQALIERYGERGFDYAGNERRDLAVWRHARHAVVVNGPAGLAEAAAAACTVEQVFARAPRGLRAWARALRLHQWLKNLLVFLPLLTAHRVFEPGAGGRAALAFLAFGLCASGVYLLNDLLDLEADRRHPRKRLRPFAAGTLPAWSGLLLMPLLTLAAFALAIWLAPLFAFALLAYWLLTLAYSFALKRVPMLDVIVLAALYTLRIVAGGAAIPVAVSGWLLAFALCLFLGLALLKREIEFVRVAAGAGLAGRGYRPQHRRLLRGCGIAAGIAAVGVLALYVDSTKSAALYAQPQHLWWLVGLLALWLARLWRLAARGRMHDDPLVFALTDWPSLLAFGLAAAIVLAAL